MQQAHDAYILGLLDTVLVLCRTGLEEELTIRYLASNGLIPTVAANVPFKKLTEEKQP